MGITEDVESGVAWLDQVKPGWHTLVDLPYLDMDSPRYCVAGQVFHRASLSDGYWHVWKLLDGFPLDTQGRPAVEQFGFYNPCEPEALRREWKSVIRARQATS